MRDLADSFADRDMGHQRVAAQAVPNRRVDLYSPLPEALPRGAALIPRTMHLFIRQNPAGEEWLRDWQRFPIQ